MVAGAVAAGVPAAVGVVAVVAGEAAIPAVVVAADSAALAVEIREVEVPGGRGERAFEVSQVSKTRRPGAPGWW